MLLSHTAISVVKLMNDYRTMSASGKSTVEDFGWVYHVFQVTCDSITKPRQKKSYRIAWVVFTAGQKLDTRSKVTTIFANFKRVYRSQHWKSTTAKWLIFRVYVHHIYYTVPYPSMEDDKNSEKRQNDDTAQPRGATLNNDMRPFLALNYEVTKIRKLILGCQELRTRF